MSPCGLVLLFRHVPPISNTRTHPQGCVLVFGHVPSPSRTAEQAPVGSFWCSGTFPLPSPVQACFLPILSSRMSPCGLVLLFGHVPSPFPCLKHQNTPLWARPCVQSCPPHLQQQKHALSGMFLLSDTHTHPPVLFGMPLPFPSSRKPQICPDR